MGCIPTTPADVADSSLQLLRVISPGIPHRVGALLCVARLSKTTVYNTLKLFVAKGIVQELTIEEKEVRYDADTKPHAHFKCIECGNVYDIALESPISPNDMAVVDRTSP